MKFFDQENQSIKQLVQTAWATLADHQGDVLLIPERDIEPNELINESDRLADVCRPNDEPRVLTVTELRDVTPMKRPKRRNPPPIIAVDAGVVNLGSLARGGIVFAVRGAACYYTSEGNVIILRYNTGAIAIDNTNKLKVLYEMGKRFGAPEFFVKEVKPLDGEPYFIEKSGVVASPDQLQDRFRNFVERIIQEEAVGILKKYGGGILLIDGALPAGSFDTPQDYILNQSRQKGMLYECNQNLIDVVAISKKTRITVEGIPIQNFLNEKYGADFVGYVPIKDAVEQERREAKGTGQSGRIRVTVAKQMYAARFGFGPSSITFRVDLHNCRGQTADEVINDVYNHCRIYGGYPKPLIEAHQYSCFLFQDFQNILAQAAIKLGAKPQEQPTMEVLFQPFGSFGK
ncbi:MAG: DNA double-strand break repair nuclease NurA [Microcoleus sp. PH2017_29_MFU_D_A]|uniref:DNA double-strand break repair nuclease NurA n=1 Tax=unclassified Microcoleus TaxID=2642155 RepID=UPI001D80D6CC|nr:MULTISPECIES: DNA double-strand break repair nuclease NurA [unclassified Microcoleus]MCC3419330.1 DNA double-strand break repair nuclease NurA [Microcoleus sp. PH2017_07_MST_O_A]MCC3508001.1 DNA double-strand break repair nuclease NurA [Microcoleus sp. PH2017_17_BER_D_A]MCC3424351.1 DNA double-strand break repair nuclease NurA [Microcoleus sp. PH2017_01_SCD_O_A]MCC3603675.1 DNA double-strand break repair nuclease NurA [Microcoleus sp. PH2017_29_MFU_D_A]MCC3636640.1 DNA double-strand break r